MKAIVIREKDQGPALHWEDTPDVQYGPDEVLVTVKATAVNRADLAQVRGVYPPLPGASEILGLEMSGVIRAIVRAHASLDSPGERRQRQAGR